MNSVWLNGNCFAQNYALFVQRVEWRMKDFRSSGIALHQQLSRAHLTKNVRAQKILFVLQRNQYKYSNTSLFRMPAEADSNAIKIGFLNIQSTIALT